MRLRCAVPARQVCFSFLPVSLLLVVLLFCCFVGLLVLVGWLVRWLPPCCWNSGVDEAADGATEQRMAGQELFSRKRLNASRRADVEGVVFEAQGNLEQSLMMSRTMSAG